MEILKVLIPAVGAVLAAVIPVIITVIAQARSTRRKISEDKKSQEKDIEILKEKLDEIIAGNEELKQGEM